MRLHTDVLERTHVLDAAYAARVRVHVTDQGSRSRDRSFDVRLTGESRRRPNFWDGSDVHAATWDQWGVFLAYLFARDPHMVAGSSPKRAAYPDNVTFHVRTGHRFRSPGFPADYHGDHTFRPLRPYVQSCTKCSAYYTWAPAEIARAGALG